MLIFAFIIKLLNNDRYKLFIKISRVKLAHITLSRENAQIY